MGKRGGDKGAQFVRNNLELLGFGNKRDALIQTVKELFENALDAVVCGPTNDASAVGNGASMRGAMLRVRVEWNHTTGFVDVVCADTGTGMRAHEIRQLCCGVFETTKAGEYSNKSAPSCGKYGLGLKAATIFSQGHVPGATLKVATTSNSREILYIELRIDPESEEPAIVQHVESFAVDEGHQRFSGTEMRISIPAPENQEDIEYAADILAVYFQSLRYTIPEFVGVDFALEIGETSVELAWEQGQHPVDRFSSDFGASMDDLVEVSDAVVHEDVEITLLRYANHVPLINADDFFLCSLTKGISTSRVWKKIGHSCRRHYSHIMNQLIASPTQCRRTPSSSPRSHARLIIAIDVSGGSLPDRATSLKYTNLRKTALDKTYLKEVQHCCQSIVEQLHQRGLIMSPQQSRDEELLLEYVPLIANAAASILNRSRQITATSEERKAETPCMEDAAVLSKSLQTLMHHQLKHSMHALPRVGALLATPQPSHTAQELTHGSQGKTMSAIGQLRQLEKEKNKGGADNEGLKALFMNLPSRISESKPVKASVSFIKGSWATSSRWMWIFSTTMLITLVPLSIELLREEQTNEVVKELLGKGFTYNQIQGMGYSVSPPQSTLSGEAAH